MTSHAKILNKNTHHVKTLNLMLKERRGVEGLYMFVFYHYVCPTMWKVESGKGTEERESSEKYAGVFLEGRDVSLNLSGIERVKRKEKWRHFGGGIGKTWGVTERGVRGNRKEGIEGNLKFLT